MIYNHDSSQISNGRILPNKLLNPDHILPEQIIQFYTSNKTNARNKNYTLVITFTKKPILLIFTDNIEHTLY